MSLLLPDYSSSSSDDEAGAAVARPVAPTAPSPPAPAPLSANPPPPSPTKPQKPQEKATKKTKKKTKKKRVHAKTAAFLPPEIQRLLESGAGGAYSSDSDDEGSELLAKRRQARRAAAASKRPRVATATSSAPVSDALSFLPLPKHEEAVEAEEKEEDKAAERVDAAQDPQAALDEQQAAYAQYYAQQQQGYAPTSDYGYAYGSEGPTVDTSSMSAPKRARLRDRELERALQQGQFHEGVLGKITEVTGPSPGAWAPPADAAAAGGPKDGELKLQASFWSTQQGARVATAKPNRLQRQKHQLNQLAFDAKAREMELLDRKGAGLKTKRETYAKYGW